MGKSVSPALGFFKGFPFRGPLVFFNKEEFPGLFGTFYTGKLQLFSPGLTSGRERAVIGPCVWSHDPPFSHS